MTHEQLIEQANEAVQYAYAPYSRYRVGAALLTEKGDVFTGVNIENASYGATICAERVAIFKAVSVGQLKFKAIAIVTAQGDFPTPCGMCRQVMAEFGGPDMEIILSNEEKTEVYRLEELLPLSFTGINLTEGVKNAL